MIKWLSCSIVLLCLFVFINCVYYAEICSFCICLFLSRSPQCCRTASLLLLYLHDNFFCWCWQRRRRVFNYVVVHFYLHFYTVWRIKVIYGSVFFLCIYYYYHHQEQRLRTRHYCSSFCYIRKYVNLIFIKNYCQWMVKYNSYLVSDCFVNLGMCIFLLFLDLLTLSQLTRDGI